MDDGPLARIAASLAKAALQGFAAEGDKAATTAAFALLVNSTAKPIFWLRDDRPAFGRHIYAPGLVHLG